MVVTLTVGLYQLKSRERLEEIRYVFKKNCENKYIDKIFVLFERIDLVKDINDYEFLYNSKIVIINVFERQTFEMMFNFCNMSNCLNIVANADIIFDRSLKLVEDLTYDQKTMYMITRWEKDNIKDKYWKLTLQKDKLEAWSFDSYLFRSPIDISKIDLDIKLGVACCDSYLQQKLTDKGYYLANPCIDIRTFHHHFSDKRPIDLEGYWQRNDYKHIKGLRIETIDGKTIDREFRLES